MHTTSLSKPLCWVSAFTLVLAAACSDDTSKATDAGGSAGSGGGGMCSMPGVATAGPKDSHCGSNVVVASQADCHPADAGLIEPPSDDAGAAVSDFGDTMYGTEGDDDDCKYHLAWTSTALCSDQDIYFTVKLTNKSDGSVVKGAKPEPDITLTDTHPGITDKSKAVEGPDGTYKIGPVKLDASGKWTVRFHFFGDCTDSETSPHGHAAFFVTVP